jgi:Sigma-70 region 2
VADWDRIVREQGPLVYRTAWRILGHAADTEDVVQEVFLQVHQFVQSRPVRPCGTGAACCAGSPLAVRLIGCVSRRVRDTRQNKFGIFAKRQRKE